MSNYTQVNSNYTSRDSLTHGDPAKIIKGLYLDQEFGAITTAIASKADAAGPVFTGAALFADGLAATPSISFTLDTNTGLFREQADQFAAVCGGTISASFLSTGIAANNGTAAAPSFRFQSEASGMFRAGANSIGFAVGGFEYVGVDTSLGLRLTNATVVNSAPGAGGQTPLPATPSGYLKIAINAVSRYIPFF